MSKSNKRPPIVFIIGILLVCLTLISLHMNSGLYARYSSTAIGQNTAQVAKIAVQMTGDSVNYTINKSYYEFNTDLGSVFAVIVTFDVKNTGDVAYEYQLNLRFSDANNTSYETAAADAYITLAAPKNLSYVKQIMGNDSIDQDASAAGMTQQAITMFNSGNAYYAVSADGSSYIWSAVAVQNDGTVSIAEQPLEIGQTHSYQLIYFIQMKPETAFKEMKLFYSATCEQID